MVFLRCAVLAVLLSLVSLIVLQNVPPKSLEADDSGVDLLMGMKAVEQVTTLCEDIEDDATEREH